MSEAYMLGKAAGKFHRDKSFDMKRLNPYKAGTIEAQEWDRGFNHAVYANNYDD